jgi:hypothetical protein
MRTVMDRGLDQLNRDRAGFIRHVPKASWAEHDPLNRRIKEITEMARTS